jgi:carboxyl-terminal processing protease
MQHASNLQHGWSQELMKYRGPILLIAVILLSSLIVGLLEGNTAPRSATYDATQTNAFLADFTEALDVIQKNHADNIDTSQLVYGAIKGMLHALDPHSNFLDPQEFAKLREEQHSIYFGLGIHIHPLSINRGRHVIVEQPTAGTPAERKGLRLGDVLTQIEGKPIEDWPTDEVVNHLKGPRRTPVRITIERPGAREPLQFEVERDEIPMNTVPYAFELKPGIGYAKIERFSEATAKELRAKLEPMKDMAGLILDLRDNPGGLLNQAIEISDLFLHRGDLIVSTKGRISNSVRSFEAPGEGRIQVPLVILINRQSASASEIVAGALQDHDRGLIVGDRSFGKGLVQTVYTLENNTGMTLTTARYYTPSGRLIQRDYSGSVFAYYYMDTDNASAQKIPETELHYTDGKRKVYGGGGITPDISEPAHKYNRFETTLGSKDVFFQFGRHLIKDRPGSAAWDQIPHSFMNLEVTDTILADFEQFLRNQRIDFSEDDFRTNLDFIQRRIRQDTCISAFGIREAYKIGLLGDPQVLKALEVMPEAKALMISGRAVRVAQNRP